MFVASFAYGVRKFNPAPTALKMGAVNAGIPTSWTVPHWYIDPQNVTGCASDTTNSGQSSTCSSAGVGPLLSYTELARRWTTQSPHLRQVTTITWLSSSACATESVALSPFLENNAYVVLQGVLGTAQQVATGTLASVVPKNRATPQLLNAALPASAIQQFVVNATHPSVAWTYKSLGAGSYAISQPVATIAMPPIYASVPAEVDSWANGDAVTVYTPTSVCFQSLAPTVDTVNIVAGALNEGVYVYHLTGAAGPFGVFDSLIANTSTVFVESAVLKGLSVSGAPILTSPYFQYNNAFVCATVVPIGQGDLQFTEIAGEFIDCLIASSVLIDGDAIVGLVFGGALGADALPQFGKVYLDTGTLNSAGNLQVANLYYGAAAIWGPGILNEAGSGRLQYIANTSVASFLGTVKINGHTTACAVDSSGDPSIVHCGRPLTPFMLDQTITNGGFGGCAQSFGGASICSN